MALARVLGVARLQNLRDGSVEQRPERGEQLAGQVPGLLRVTGAADPHRVVEGTIPGPLQIHAEPLDLVARAVEQGDGAAVDRLHQRDMGDAVVHLAVPVPVVGVVKEGQVARLGGGHLASCGLERHRAVPDPGKVDPEPGSAVDREHVPGAVEAPPLAEHGASDLQDVSTELGASCAGLLRPLLFRSRGGRGRLDRLRPGWLAVRRLCGRLAWQRLRRGRGLRRAHDGVSGSAAPCQGCAEEEDRCGARDLHRMESSCGSKLATIPETAARRAYRP
jgi:hypothetical protein